MDSIDDKTLEHLYALARIEPEKNGHKRKKLLADLAGILKHFEELEEVDTRGVDPLAGGSFLAGVVRKDEVAGGGPSGDMERNASVDQFPEQENGYLKVPPIF